jgi:hypothetical protein
MPSRSGAPSDMGVMVVTTEYSRVMHAFGAWSGNLGTANPVSSVNDSVKSALAVSVEAHSLKTCLSQLYHRRYYCLPVASMACKRDPESFVFFRLIFAGLYQHLDVGLLPGSISQAACRDKNKERRMLPDSGLPFLSG